MTDQKIRKRRAALSRRRVALGLIAMLIVARAPAIHRGEADIYKHRRRPRRRRRRRNSYSRRR